MTFVVWYRKEPPGVPTASDHKFGTGEGALVYQTRRSGRLVQEKGLWCTKREDVAGWYRRRGFGVPTASDHKFGTGEGALVYQRRSEILPERVYSLKAEYNKRG